MTTSCSSSVLSGVQSVRVALLTPPGRGALAVVGIRGAEGATLVDGLFTARGGGGIASRPDGAIAFGSWRTTGEDVVVVRHRTDRIEVHCHGGEAASAAVLAALETAGAIRGDWSEWLEGEACAREALAALPEAVGPKAAMILCRQAAGLLDRELARLAERRASGSPDRQGAARLLAASRVGLRLMSPWRVVFAGSVNAGKSSLMNAVLGHARSIVSPLAGTTRDVVTAMVVLDGWGVELIDVAGERPDGAPCSAIEREGIRRAEAERARADLVIEVLPSDDLPAAMPPPQPGTIRVISKGDLAPEARVPGAILTSAVSGAGIAAVAAAIVDHLVPEDRGDPALLAGPVAFTPRQIAILAGLA